MPPGNRVLPVTLLIIAGLAGLQAEVTGPRWDGPLHRDAVAVGIVLEFVLGIMLGITVRRLAAARAHAGTARDASRTGRSSYLSLHLGLLPSERLWSSS